MSSFLCCAHQTAMKPKKVDPKMRKLYRKRAREYDSEEDEEKEGGGSEEEEVGGEEREAKERRKAEEGFSEYGGEKPKREELYQLKVMLENKDEMKWVLDDDVEWCGDEEDRGRRNPTHSHLSRLLFQSILNLTSTS